MKRSSRWKHRTSLFPLPLRGYTLNYSADGKNFTPWTDGTLAEVTQVVACAACGMYYKLVGNVGDVVITF